MDKNSSKIALFLKKVARTLSDQYYSARFGPFGAFF